MERTPNKSQRRKSTLEEKILPPLLPGIEKRSSGHASVALPRSLRTKSICTQVCCLRAHYSTQQWEVNNHFDKCTVQCILDWPWYTDLPRQYCLQNSESACCKNGPACSKVVQTDNQGCFLLSVSFPEKGDSTSPGEVSFTRRSPCHPFAVESRSLCSFSIHFSKC